MMNYLSKRYLIYHEDHEAHEGQISTAFLFVSFAIFVV
jgi:hypothetical protein